MAICAPRRKWIVLPLMNETAAMSTTAKAPMM